MNANNIKNASISHGTMRPQDLIPAFLGALESIDPDGYEQVMLAPFGVILAYVMDEGEASPWWDSEDAADVVAQLFDTLDAAAPEGFYFGAHPGDGCDYGFWEIEDQ
jgi:hypothetical protein